MSTGYLSPSSESASSSQSDASEITARSDKKVKKVLNFDNDLRVLKFRTLKRFNMTLPKYNIVSHKLFAHLADTSRYTDFIERVFNTNDGLMYNKVKVDFVWEHFVRLAFRHYEHKEDDGAKARRSSVIDQKMYFGTDKVLACAVNEFWRIKKRQMKALNIKERSGKKVSWGEELLKVEKMDVVLMEVALMGVKENHGDMEVEKTDGAMEVEMIDGATQTEEADEHMMDTREE